MERAIEEAKRKKLRVNGRRKTAAFALAMPSNTRTKNQAASFGTSSIGSDTFLGAEEEHRGQCSFSYFLRDIPHFMQSPEMKSNL